MHLKSTIDFQSSSQRIIGLTGGISTGKTTVSRYLAGTYNLPILDADIYAREAVQPGSQSLKQIAERYGNTILLPDGRLDRQRLGEIVFSNSHERHWIEEQIHPYVRQCFVTQLAALKVQNYPTVVLVVPLLFEANLTDLVTEIWVVSCSETEQLQRLMARDRLPLAQAQARINSQMPLTKKVACADIVLENSSTLEALLQQVDAAYLHPHRRL
jgi:dephospho-CoA kinase